MSDGYKELRQWADYYSQHGLGQAKLVLNLLAERDSLKSLNESLAERVAVQSEILSRLAAKNQVPVPEPEVTK